MNKGELVTAVAQKVDMTKKDVEKVIIATLASIKTEVAKKGKVQVIGFGTFEARARKARTCRNPRTKKEMQVPATVVPVFKAGKAFKDAVKPAPTGKKR